MIVLKRGLPFEAKIPNEETLKAMKEAMEMEREHESVSH